MEKLDIFLGQKRKINAVYKRILGRVPFIGFQEESEGGQSSCWSTAVLFKKRIDIPSLQKELRNTGIPSRRVFMPLIEFPPFKKYKKGDYRNAYYVYERGLCLPSSTLNSEADICYVCDVIIKLLKDN